MVRPGLVAYGVAPTPFPVSAGAETFAASLRPAMTIKARALRVETVRAGEPVGYGGTWVADRESRVATLPIGYGDGWARASSPGAMALVRGRRVPLVGTVAMDAVTADVTEVADVGAADEFVLLGAQGEERIETGELARLRTTISWEVLAGMARRIPRVYDAGSEVTGMRTLAGERLRK
ncbi:MAG: hypothetical protein H0V12_10980 [Chloroflexi bacterium]|nr:hypothetical protein [Chloroflexota bacterium]